MALDLATSGDIERLVRVLAVANIRAKNADALNDSEEDIRRQCSLRGQTNDHQVTSRTEVVNSLLVCLRRRSGDDGGVRAEPVARSLDICDDVLGLLEVDPRLCAETFDEGALLGASVDGTYAKTHRDGVLDRKVTKTSTSAGEDDPVADLRVRVLDRTIGCYALRDGTSITGLQSKIHRRTAQRIDAASAESRASGIGVTWRTHDFTYSENVPSTVKPEYRPWEHTE